MMVVWRRVRATEFVSKFKDDPSGHWVDEENNPISDDQHRMNVENGYELDDTWVPDTNEFPIDRDLKDQFATDPMWKITLMSMLIDIYRRYNKGEIVLEEPNLLSWNSRDVIKMSKIKLVNLLLTKLLKLRKKTQNLLRLVHCMMPFNCGIVKIMVEKKHQSRNRLRKLLKIVLVLMREMIRLVRVVVVVGII